MKIFLTREFSPELASRVSSWMGELVRIEPELKNLYDTVNAVCKDDEPFVDGLIPVVVCESRQDLKKAGVLCPYEFIIERHHLVPIVGDKGDLLTNPKAQLCHRLECLAKKYPQGITCESIRDWFAGLFRRYMFLDETVHGTSNLIDLDNLEKDRILEHACTNPIPKDDEAANKLFKRFTGRGAIQDALYCYKALLEKLFTCETAEVKKALEDKNPSALVEIYERCRDSYVDENPPPYPRPLGDRAKYVTPTNKIDILLIDDKPDEIDNRLDPRCIQLFNIQKLQVDKKKRDVFETVKDAFFAYQSKGLSFNLVLVDLCLGDETGGDLTGYRMIKYVRKHLPGLPIVVYSRYSDMDHMTRAFLCGARWFLVKGEESKLPRHVLRMLKQSGWHREWESIKHSSEAPDFLPHDDRSLFMRRFRQKDEWQYLTYKGLEYFPGHFITIEKMGEGISAAVTFKAVKGVKLDGEYLQSPCIIKIDSAFNTAMEYERYFRMIRPYMSNEAGRVERPERVLNRDNASIAYTFAGRQDPAHSLKSMGEMIKSVILYETSCDYEKFRFAFDMVFDEILPKIHRVTPNREFGEGTVYDLHSGAIDSPESKMASFPNILFNEFSIKDFYKGYLSRMQPWNRIKLPEGAKFISQPKYDEQFHIIGKAEEYANARWFTFHGIFRIGDCYVLEVFDSEQHLVWIEGLLADHAARFRRLISPGKTLWISGLTDADVQRDYREAWFGESMKECEGDHAKVRDFKSDICLFAGIKQWQNEASEIEETNEEVIKHIIGLEDDLIMIAMEVGSVLGKSSRIWGCEFRSPIAIVHGDLNYGNIMLESRRQTPPKDRPNERWKITDAWFIDFARTRRDVIAHDFNVAFTATLSLLFEQKLLDNPTYKKKLHENYVTLVESAFTSSSTNLEDVHDDIKDSPRFVMIYQMLRRIRFAALKAGVSSHMYLLTTALACAYTVKIFLNKQKYELAAGLVVAMKICYDILRKDILDDDFKRNLNPDFKWEP